MRLIIVSNRLPFTVSVEEGQPQFRMSPGGLTTGLWSFLERAAKDPAKSMEFLWLGWPGAGIPPEHAEAVRQHGQQFRAVPVFLPDESANRFYQLRCGFAVRTCDQVQFPFR